MPDFKTIDRLADIIAGVDTADPAEIRELLYALVDKQAEEGSFADYQEIKRRESAIRKAKGEL